LYFVLFSFTILTVSEWPWTLRASEKSFAFGTACECSNERVGRGEPFSGRSKRPSPNENAMELDYIRREIERMRTQVRRQRGEIRQLQRAGIPTTSAEALLERMLDKIDELCAERDKLKKDQPGPTKGKILGGRQW
jgi:hypothetical protein